MIIDGSTFDISDLVSKGINLVYMAIIPLNELIIKELLFGLFPTGFQ